MDIVHHIFFVGLTVAKLSIVLVYPLSNDIRMPGNAGSTRLFFLVAEKKVADVFLKILNFDLVSSTKKNCLGIDLRSQSPFFKGD